MISDFDERLYFNKIGKFFSVDPANKLTPWSSTYSFAANSPIFCIDVNGLIPVIITIKHTNKNGTESETVITIEVITIEDLKGIYRDPLKLTWYTSDVPQEEGSDMYKWQDDGYSIDLKSGKTYNQKFKASSPGEYWAWFISGTFVTEYTPIGSFGKTITGEDPMTGEVLTPEERLLSFFSGVIQAATLGNAAASGGTKGLLKELAWTVADFTIEQNADKLLDVLGLDDEQRFILSYYIAKFVLTGDQINAENMKGIILDIAELGLKGAEAMNYFYKNNNLNVTEVATDKKAVIKQAMTQIGGDATKRVPEKTK